MDMGKGVSKVTVAPEFFCKVPQPVSVRWEALGKVSTTLESAPPTYDMPKPTPPFKNEDLKDNPYKEHLIATTMVRDTTTFTVVADDHCCGMGRATVRSKRVVGGESKPHLLSASTGCELPGRETFRTEYFVSPMQYSEDLAVRRIHNNSDRSILIKGPGWPKARRMDKDEVLEAIPAGLIGMWEVISDMQPGDTCQMKVMAKDAFATSVVHRVSLDLGCPEEKASETLVSPPSRPKNSQQNKPGKTKGGVPGVWAR
jgi:hypothetical protein